MEEDKRYWRPETNSKLNAIQFGPFVIRPSTVDEMRGWIGDAGFADALEDPDFHHDLTPHEVVRGVRNSYGGGVQQFLRDMML